MLDDLFAKVHPPPGALVRLRASLRRRSQRRRRRRAAAGATLVLAAVLATLQLSRDPVASVPASVVVEFDASLHPAIALVDDAVLPTVALRGSTAASARLLRHATLDEDVVLYELAP